MDSLSGLLAFVRAAEMRSFVAAGERLGVSASAVGKNVARLEDTLGVRLLHRSTRRISLTEAGALFFERCQRIVKEIEEAEAELSRLTDAPTGRLRVSMPAVGYRLLLPILPQFTHRYPSVELDIDFNDRLVDIVAEGVDVAIRSADPGNSQLRTRRLGSFRFKLVSSPAYFDRHGIPRRPDDLQHHACLHYKFPTTGLLQSWNLDHKVTDSPLQLSGTLTFNNVEALITAAMGGLGIAYLPDFAVREALTAGTLTPVLEDHLVAGGTFSVLWPSNRHLLPKLRVFVDFLTERLILGP